MTTDSIELYTASPTEDVALVPTHAIVIAPAEPLEQKSRFPQGEISVLILQTFPDAPKMLQVAIAESDLVPTAKNPHSSATGLFGVLNGTRDAYHCGDQRIVEESIKCARKIYDAEGLTPWNASRTTWGQRI